MRYTGFKNALYFEDGLATRTGRTHGSSVSIWICEFRCVLVGTSIAWPWQEFQPGITPESYLETSAYRASGVFAPHCVADVCRCAAQQLPPSSEEASIRQPRDDELTGHRGRKCEVATRRGQGDERETGDTGKVVRRDPIFSQSKAPPPLNPT